jgi:hypothetical protein
MTNEQTMETIITHASQQSDRYLFVGALVVLGFFAMAVMRYFVAQHERLIEDHKLARETYQTSLSSIVSEQSTTAVKLAEVIARNTSALEECTTELRAMASYRGRQ